MIYVALSSTITAAVVALNAVSLTVKSWIGGLIMVNNQPPLMDEVVI